MKKSLKLFTLFIASVAMLMPGCKNPEEEQQGGLEAKINSIQIVNAGLSGGDAVNGVVDNEAFTVTFEGVAAETNIAAVKFSAKCSLGAKLESDVIDFSKDADPATTVLTGALKVINSVIDSKGNEKKVEQAYSVTINLKAPEQAPVLEKMVIKDQNGTEVTLTPANIIDGILCLGVPESATAEVVSVTLSPARATYKFTTANEGVIQNSNPGMFVMDFMGLTTEYEVVFAASPKAGADWSKAVVHDFSVVTGHRYVDLDEEYTRGGDFDGQYVLLANRTAPKLFKIEDLLNDNTGSPITLDMTGIEGGTHIVSAGRLTQGHIYLCNLATVANDIEGGAGPLKVYHYATPSSKPEVVLSWAGDGLENPDPELYDEYAYSSRIGDNMSISLDESGNGYAFFFKQEADNKFFRFTVRNFTEFSDVKELMLPAISNYYGMMNPVGPDQYLFTSSYQTFMWLLDAEGNSLREVEWTKCPNGQGSTHACDPRVIEFNRARYIMLMNARRFGWWPVEGVNVYDISEGNDIVSALVKLQEHLAYDEEDNPTPAGPIDPVYYYNMDSETISSACVSLCNCAIVNDKLVIFCAAPHVGFAIIEVPKAE